MNVSKEVLRLAISFTEPAVTSDFVGVPLVLVDVADLPSSTIASDTETLYTVLSKESWDEMALQADGVTNSDSDSYMAVADLFNQETVNGYSVSKVLIGVNRATTWLLTFNAIWGQTKDFVVCVAGVKDGGVEATITDLLATAKKVQEVGRVYCGVTDDSDTKTEDALSATLASQLKDDDVNSFLAYSEDTDSFSISAVLGQVLPEHAACTNPCYKALAGVTGDSITDTEFGYIQAKNCNVVIDDGDDAVMVAFNGSSDAGGQYGGICSDGQFFDLNFAKAYMSLEIPSRFYSNYVKKQRKINFNTVGSAEINRKLTSIIKDICIIEPPEAFIEDDFTLNVPDMSSTDYSATKKTQRWLDGVTGEGTSSGMVNVVNLSLNFL